MIYEVNIGGKVRPIAFGFNALASFCRLSGLKIAQLEQIAVEMDLIHVINLIYCGLKDGARKKNIPFTATIEDVGDWLDEAPGELAGIMNMFVESQTRPESKKNGNTTEEMNVK